MAGENGRDPKLSRAPMGVNGKKKIFMLKKRKTHGQVLMFIVKQGTKFG
jgi:hypothetical protein